MAFVGLTPESFQKLDDFMNGGGGGGSYTLPTMSANTKGGAMVGDGLAMTGDALGIGDGGVDMDMLSQEVQEAIAEGDSGYNPSLSVGRADALTGADSTAQWMQRVTEGSGSATVRSVQGAAVAFHQYIKDAAANWSAISGVASYSDGVVTMTPNGGGGFTYADIRQTFSVTSVAGHKYLVSLDFLREHWDDISQADDYCFPTLYGTWLSTWIPTLVPSKSVTTWQHLSAIVTQQNGGQTGVLTVRCYGATYPLSIKNVMLFDLTQMFGAGNEPTTVAEFERMYPDSYYPYSAPTLKPVQISGIRSTDAQGGELDSVEWTAQTLRAAGSVADMLYADHVDVNVGVVDLGTLTWVIPEPNTNVFYTTFEQMPIAGTQPVSCAAYTVDNTVSSYSQAKNMADKSIAGGHGTNVPYIYIKDSAYTDPAALKASLAGVLLFYELATSTTTPISPALPMTYKVEQGGTESIIVPTGEVSAAPILTVAEGESAAELVMDALACIATPDGPTATANHAINTYLTMGGKLYKVTSAIAVGETIAAGTNVTETTVMAELIALTQ